MAQNLEELLMGIANTPKAESSNNVDQQEKPVETNTGNPSEEEDVQEEVAEEEHRTQEDSTDLDSEGSKESDQDGDKEQKEEVEEEDFSFEDWDQVEVDDEEEVKTESVDYSSIAKELGFDDVTDKDAFTAKISEMREQLNEFKSKSETFSEIPEDLKGAIDLYKKGGDYLSYLGVSSQDYTGYSNEDLVANSLAKHFTDSEGNLDKEALDEYISEMSEKDIKIRGAEIRERLTENQKNQKLQLERQAEQSRNEQKKQLKSALDKIEDVDGFKIGPAHKKQIYDKVMEGSMLKDLFYNKSGELDYSKVASVYFRELNRSKINKYLETKIKNATKKEVWRSTTNTQLDKPTSKPDVTSSQKKSPMDVYFEHYSKK